MREQRASDKARERSKSRVTSWPTVTVRSGARATTTETANQPTVVLQSSLPEPEPEP